REGAEPEEDRRDREVEASTLPVGESAEARSEENHHKARRHLEQTRFERCEAEELEIQGEEDQGAVEGRIDHERLQVRHREVPPAKELEGKHRLSRAPFEDDKRSE